MILAAQTPTQPDYVALAMVIVLLLAVIAAVLRKRFASSPAQPNALPEEAPAEIPQATTAPGSAGSVKLHNVEPKVAAMLMAIVADKTGKPLNELRFISIKEVTGS